MKKEIVKNVPIAEIKDASGKPLVPISKAVKAGGFVFVSGTTPQDPTTGKMVRGDIEVQTRRVLENMKLVLEAAGSNLDKVVKTTLFATNAAYVDRINVFYREYLPGDPPARTFVNVGSWPHEFDVEIECIALA